MTGAESREETGELHASERPGPLNMQAATWCFAMDWRGGEDHTIVKPEAYDHWSAYRPSVSPPWPGPLLSLTYTDPVTLRPREASFDPRPQAKTRGFNLWTYRRLIHPANFEAGAYRSGISLVNSPQNDYMDGCLFETERAAYHRERAQSLSLSLLYWLQTEVPPEDGGAGWRGLRLRPDVMGTSDGLAKRAYLRESRPLHTRFRVEERHVGLEGRQAAGHSDRPRAARFPDSVGIGSYRIDLHPSTGGDNYIDIASLPFEIPLGALVPVRLRNLLPACKNLGVTHVTNGCYRLHPVEWNVGEAAGALAAWCIHRRMEPHATADNPALLKDFRHVLAQRGVELHWPDSVYD